MRILMVSRTPFLRELGGGRVQLEVGEELARLGHEVEFFDPSLAFTDPTPRVHYRLDPFRFARKALAYVRAGAGRWDVIDADHGDLPYPKDQLRFDGLLVARSVGLYAFYRAHKRAERTLWPELVPGSRVARLLDAYDSGRGFGAAEQSMRHCDLANVPTEPERDHLVRKVMIRGKVVVLPFGLTEEQHARFAACRRDPEVRLGSPRVAFVGSWVLRKGRADWPAIVRTVRCEQPRARFLFLGTGASQEAIRSEFHRDDRASVDAIAAFASDELPGLLETATLGAFPSYVEGFGFGVLEALAAGLPTVAYDVSGPRVMLGDIDMPLVHRGDVKGFAQAILRLLALRPDEYATRSEACVDVASRFQWREIARQTADAYARRLGEVRGSVR